MNTKEQAIMLSEKVNQLINDKKVILKITLLSDQKFEAKILRMESSIDKDGIFKCSIFLFIHDIENPKEYNLYEIKDIN